MRQAGTISDEQDAARFADYLLTEGIKSRVDPGEGGSVVWIRDEDQLDAAREALAKFQADPTHERYQQATRPAEKIRQDDQKREKQFLRNLVNMRGRFSRVGATSGPTPVCTALIVISIVVAGLTGLGDEKNALRPYLLIGTGPGEVRGLSSEVLHGQVWRLVTPCFLHFSMMHIFFNMYWVYILGRLVESRKGTRTMLVLFFASGILSNIAQYAITDSPNFGGMSGVVFGIFGYAWMKTRYEPSSGIMLPPTTIIFVLIYFAICFTGGLGPIANWAHGGGLVVGVLMGGHRDLWRQFRG